MNKPKFWTLKEVAELLSTSVISVQALIRSGDLVAYRFNQRFYRVSETDLEDFLAKSKVKQMKRVIPQ